MTTHLSRIHEFASRAPLASWLGFQASGEDDIVFRLTFNETHIGNPAIRALHGGVIAAFLELSMQADLFARAGAAISTANISIDYLSSSRPENMTGRVKLLRQGRRIAFMEASGWQADETRLVAVARACFTLG
ncbi:MAG: PaaI family thioesterase [Pseudomonadota bacterium]